MADPQLPPSRFGAGYVVGSPATAPSATAPTVVAPANPTQPGGGPGAPMIASAGVNPLAVAAFGLIVLFGPFAIPLSLPLAYVARAQLTSSSQGGGGLAKAAIALNFVYVAVAATVVVLVVLAARSDGTLL
jgi:hypothetical protein